MLADFDFDILQLVTLSPVLDTSESAHSSPQPTVPHDPGIVLTRAEGSFVTVRRD